MTKKQKQHNDLIEFCTEFVEHFIPKDDEFQKLEPDMQILVLGLCAASVGMILQHLGVQPVKKVIRTTKNKKSADA